MPPEARRYYVSGRVQGVFFRDSTRCEARKLGITGRAVNLADGRVEVLACGEPAALDELEAWLREGPRAARVDRLERSEVEEEPPPESFITG